MKIHCETWLHDGCCPPPGDVIAFVRDGGTDADSEWIRRHLEQCAGCRALVEDAQAVVGMLRQADGGPMGRDLVPEILARIPRNVWRECAHESREERFAWLFSAWMPMRIAAAVAILFVGGLLVGRLMKDAADLPLSLPANLSAVDKGIEWLLARQTSSGGWNAEELGGRPEYACALNGLAILALARAPNADSTLREPLGRAAGFVIRQQADDGRIGLDFDGTMYNQGIATLALLEVYGATHDEQLRGPVTKALAFIRGRQSPAGGWGYRDTQGAQPNTSITAWQVQSLLFAVRLGWHENRISVRKALAWMTGTVSGNGYFGYERTQHFPEGPNTLTMMGAYCVLAAQHLDIPVDSELAARVVRGMGALVGVQPEDYYGAFFYSSALAEADPAVFGDALTAARGILIARQQASAGTTGTWLADDRWGDTGGQLYSTSMALLALAPRPRYFPSL